jgi:L-fuconolactonase
MPNFPIVDTHVHLWNPQRYRMKWLEGNPTLEQVYELKEYAEHTRGVEIEAMVYAEVGVDAPYMLLEASWIAAVAQAEPRIQGIIANAPLEDGENARSFLKTLKVLSPRIKGIRRILQAETEHGFCLQARFLDGVHMLADFDFSFDICITRHQLSDAIALVRACPHVQFILDHIANPDIKNKEMSPWRERVAELAALPNVACKVSGIVTNANRDGWTPDDIRPYVEHILTCFGEDRVMYGGDWSVVLLASSYARWVEALDAVTTHLPETQRRKLWVENAKRIYRL